MITIKAEKMMELCVLSDKLVQTRLQILSIVASFLMLLQLCRHSVLQLVSTTQVYRCIKYIQSGIHDTYSNMPNTINKADYIRFSTFEFQSTYWLYCGFGQHTGGCCSNRGSTMQILLTKSKDNSKHVSQNVIHDMYI